MSGDGARDDIEAADLRNGEPGASDWTETDEPSGPAPSDLPPLEREPEDGQLPSDPDVQAERQP